MSHTPFPHISEYNSVYRQIEQQGGTLQQLAEEVSGGGRLLQQLRERMEKELWKAVLKAEAAMMEKEGGGLQPDASIALTIKEDPAASACRCALL